MAQIALDKVAHAIRSILRQEAEMDQAGIDFKAGIRNGKTFSSPGIEMCLGETEGFSSILHAFNSLSLPTTPEQFASTISEAIQESLRSYPDDDRSLVYPHFRFHGLLNISTSDIATKIINNARIIRETLSSREEVQKIIERRPPELPSTMYTMANFGIGDDFEGLSLQLFLKKAPGKWDEDLLLAKVGFYMDHSECTLYVANLQGRKPISPSSSGSTRSNRLVGRVFGGFATHFGAEPRLFILKHLIEHTGTLGFRAIRAIRPDSHVMKISAHPGFIGNYDKVLEDAGMEIEDEVYRIRRLKQPL